MQVAPAYLLRRYLQTHGRGGVKNCLRNFFSICYYRQFNSHDTIQEKIGKINLYQACMLSATVEYFGHKTFPATKTKEYQQNNSLWLFSDQSLVRDFPSAEILDFQVSFQT